MNIRDFVDIKKLQRIQDDFSSSSNLAIIILDVQGEYITNGSNFTDFCMKCTKNSTEGAKRCKKSVGTSHSEAFFCHAGLMESVQDIIVNGEIVGKIIGGQILANQPDYNKLRLLAQELSISPNEYEDAVKKVPIRTEKEVKLATKMLGILVNQFVNLEYVENVYKKQVGMYDIEIPNILKCVERITKTTKTLQDVAMMEKLLAINASIEASRAGTNGVGFSVVAKEIGDLSDKSEKSYAEIDSNIEKIEKSLKLMKLKD